MVRPRGQPSTGRHRIEISRREDKGSRQVTVSKRRAGLFKKGSELAVLCGARVAIVVFSEADNVFAFGSPSVDAVLAHDGPLLGGDEALEEVCRATEATRAEVAAEAARMDAIGEKVAQAQAGRRFWWEADVEALGEAELPEFARALERLKEDVSRRAEKLLSAPPPPPAAAASAPAAAAVAPNMLSGDQC